ncbi:MAG: NAD-dependent epimerase/dehydratase family protein [Candidatus Pelagibacter sp.]
MKSNTDIILITGGSGFIGKYITKFFIKRNFFVINYDINPIKNFTSSNYKFVKGDVTKIKDLKKVFKQKIKYVFHLAAINGTKNFYDFPVKVLEVSSFGILNICKLCEEFKVKKLFIFSSSEVYNESKIIPTNEKIRIKIPDITNPRFSYSGGKILSELVGLNYALEKRIKNVVIIRPHNVYGSDMGFGHVIPELYKKISLKKFSKNIKLKIIGTGNEIRSFIYIDDFLNGFYKVFKKGKNRNIYNIGNNEPINIRKLILLFARILNIKINISTQKGHIGGPKKRVPDILKIKKFGYKKKYNIYNGLKKFIENEKI